MNVHPPQKTESPVLHIRIPKSVYDFIETTSKREVRTKNAVVLRILLQAMGQAKGYAEGRKNGR